MSYRRKSPRAKDIPFAQQLKKFCNAAVGSIPFESHYSHALMLHLHSDANAKKNFSDAATIQKFVPSRLVRKSELKKDVEPIQLPLPQFFIDLNESADDFEPRAFYHINDLKEEKEFDVKSLPRCGMSGLFFSREEVMDNLAAAADDLNFTSPFWIKEDYSLLQSGYLSLKDGSDAIVVSLTSSVAGCEVLPPCFHSFLHPTLHQYMNKKSVIDFAAIGKDVPQGMNVISGFVSKNPFIQSLPRRGLWISLDQLLCLEEATSSADQFTLVEVDQWSLYNADQLTVPGRLGLKRKVDISESIFHPL